MKIVVTPDWFLGKDVLIDGFSFLVLAIFFILCIRYYRNSKKKNFLYLGIGFLLVAVAQLAAILTKTVLYYDTTFIQNIGQMIVTYHIFKSVDIIYYIGFFFSKLLTLLGFYLIYRLITKKKFSGDALLAVYFIVISAVIGTATEHIFHLTVLFLLGLIIGVYYEIYQKNKLINTKILLIAFVLLALAHVIMLAYVFPVMIVAANIIELVSYIILLVLIIRIFRSHTK